MDDNHCRAIPLICHPDEVVDLAGRLATGSYIQPYNRGGPTVLTNLQRFCGPHNRARYDDASEANLAGHGTSFRS